MFLFRLSGLCSASSERGAGAGRLASEALSMGTLSLVALSGISGSVAGSGQAGSPRSWPGFRHSLQTMSDSQMEAVWPWARHRLQVADCC